MRSRTAPSPEPFESLLAPIRRRLNAQAITAVVCPALGAMFLLGAAVVVLALRGTSAVFLAGTAGALLGTAIVILTSAFSLRRRWASTDRAAQLADDRTES